MKRALLATAASLALAGIAPGAPENLFNGKDLAGWSGHPEFWSVRDGVIVGETTKERSVAANTFLIHEGEPLRDFELTLKVRVTGNNNSGIQYRSKVLDEKTWSVGGYQMDVHSAPNYLGMLYEEKGRGILAERGQKVRITAEGEKEVTGELEAEKQIEIAQWNEFTIVAEGNTLTHKINGDMTVVVVDEQEDQRALSGVLALQLHRGAPMKVEVKDIVLTRHDEPAPGEDEEKK